ncbi:MAG: tRNA uridine-5-carboxymethylaminomethyl(34) synthesis GTPase MnmE [Defluviitaleaceae bacterium]|nr:tRNA uridine-5-carboxymethylaminomethyl(34) synthesis GTPase MnmE [Defluviitaleaceae bacterium]
MDYNYDNTIAAISTAIGGGIGIIRLSGKEAVTIAKSLFKPGGAGGKCLWKSHRIYYGHVVKDGRILDECMLTIMKAPKSYTKEDVVEISFHGGLKSAELILDAALGKGARLAEPGEFTKRAFLNGRIDLTKAQAVIDIINSKTELAHNQALNRLCGRLFGDITEIRGELLDLMAEIEASIDYPEYDMEEDNLKKALKILSFIKIRIFELIETGKRGIILSEGLKTVILGRPNVGKSSLLNRMLGMERAIVTDIPGTTRDVLSESLNIRGIPLNIMDTAGLRDTSDIVESIGVSKSFEHAYDADLIIYVLDGSKELNLEDLENLERLRDKKIIFVINKSDLPRKLLYKEAEGAIEISVIKNTGLDNLYNAIYNMFFEGQISIENTALISNTRDMDSLKKALLHVEAAIASVESGFTEDMTVIDIKDAYAYLGQIIGESLEDDVIDRIFSKFCLGK